MVQSTATGIEITSHNVPRLRGDDVERFPKHLDEKVTNYATTENTLWGQIRVDHTPGSSEASYIGTDSIDVEFGKGLASPDHWRPIRTDAHQPVREPRRATLLRLRSRVTPAVATWTAWEDRITFRFSPGIVAMHQYGQQRADSTETEVGSQYKNRLVLFPELVDFQQGIYRFEDLVQDVEPPASELHPPNENDMGEIPKVTLDALNRISSLSNNWDGNEAQRVHPNTIEKARLLLEEAFSVLPVNIPLPSVAPAFNGMIVVEWTGLEGRELILDVPPGEEPPGFLLVDPNAVGAEKETDSEIGDEWSIRGVIARLLGDQFRY